MATTPAEHDAMRRALALAATPGVPLGPNPRVGCVLLADDGRIKLSDFGLARAASANTATGQVLLGTIAYLSPELVTKGTADVRSDIYSLGIMLFEMLTGEQPYRGDQPVNIAYRHANETVPAPSEVNPNVPHELDELVDDRPRFGDPCVVAGQGEPIPTQRDRAAQPFAQRIQHAVADSRKLRGDLVRNGQHVFHETKCRPGYGRHR